MLTRPSADASASAASRRADASHALRCRSRSSASGAVSCFSSKSTRLSPAAAASRALQRVVLRRLLQRVVAPRLLLALVREVRRVARGHAGVPQAQRVGARAFFRAFSAVRAARLVQLGLEVDHRRLAHLVDAARPPR